MAKKTNKPQSIENVISEYGKIPPQAIDLEEAVLGAMMLESDCTMTGLDILKADCFYNESNKKIFLAIAEISNNNEKVDILTVKDTLVKNQQLDEIGGPYYLSQLTTKVASGAHIEYHARIVYQKYIQREMIRVSSEIQRRAYEQGEDVDDLLEFSQNEFFVLSEGSMRREAQLLRIVIDETIEQIQAAGAKDDSLSGVPSGFTSLDRITSGWQPSDLVIIAARPSMGKTAFVLSMARNMAVEHNVGVAIFSLEMASVQLAKRLLVSETELASEKIRNGRLAEYEWEQLHSKSSRLIKAPIYIDETPAISISELRAKSRRLVAQNNVKLIVVDYLQLMSGPTDSKGSREQEVSTISRSLKAMAKDLNVPVIALSQLNRSVESRAGDKRPQLSDLRESGAIEQDADIVIFIHRPERYGIEEKDGVNLKGLAQIIIAKHRNGAVTDVDLRFIEKFAKFTDWDDPLDLIADSNGGSSVVFKSKMNNSLSDDNITSNINFDKENQDPPF